VSGGGGSGQAIPVPPWAETPSLLPTGPEVLRFVPQEPPGRRFLPTVPAPAATLGIRKGPGVSRLPGPSSVDFRGEFENPCPHLRTLSLRRSRGFYNHDQRCSEATVTEAP